MKYVWLRLVLCATLVVQTPVGAHPLDSACRGMVSDLSQSGLFSYVDYGGATELLRETVERLRVDAGEFWHEESDRRSIPLPHTGPSRQVAYDSIGARGGMVLSSSKNELHGFSVQPFLRNNVPSDVYAQLEELATRYESVDPREERYAFGLKGRAEIEAFLNKMIAEHATELNIPSSGFEYFRPELGSTYGTLEKKAAPGIGRLAYVGLKNFFLFLGALILTGLVDAGAETVAHIEVDRGVLLGLVASILVLGNLVGNVDRFFRIALKPEFEFRSRLFNMRDSLQLDDSSAEGPAFSYYAIRSSDGSDIALLLDRSGKEPRLGVFAAEPREATDAFVPGWLSHESLDRHAEYVGTPNVLNDELDSPQSAKTPVIQGDGKLKPRPRNSSRGLWAQKLWRSWIASRVRRAEALRQARDNFRMAFRPGALGKQVGLRLGSTDLKFRRRSRDFWNVLNADGETIAIFDARRGSLLVRTAEGFVDAHSFERLSSSERSSQPPNWEDFDIEGLAQ